jgi:tripartite ATP-independent transporter DctP family solute receptor
MMMLKKCRCLVLVMALILAVVSGSAFAAKKSVKIIYGSVFDSPTYFCKADVYFKELVEKNSKGQISVELYPSSQLGPVPEMYQAVKSGAQQMTTSAIGEFIPFWPKYVTYDLPYLYRDQKHLLKVAKKFTAFNDQEEMATKIGMRVVGMRIRPSRHLNTKFPVNKLEDIKGIKMRVPQSPVSLALWRALGTVPTVVPGAEIYTALATGVVDAQENPIDGYYISKFYEVAKYCALTAHKTELVPIVANNNWWKGLSAAQRKIIADALDKSDQMSCRLAMKSEEEAKKLLITVGMKFTQPDLKPFREKAKTIWRQFGDEELIRKIQAIK